MQAHRAVPILAIALVLSTQTLCLAGQSQAAQQSAAVEQAGAAFRAGYAARQAGDLKSARTHFADVVRLTPQIPEGHEALGTVLLELGSAPEAVSELEIAAKLKPNDPGIETNFALALAQANRSEEHTSELQSLRHL